jgi:hypothetical protein
VPLGLACVLVKLKTNEILHSFAHFLRKSSAIINRNLYRVVVNFACVSFGRRYVHLLALD